MRTNYYLFQHSRWLELLAITILIVVGTPYFILDHMMSIDSIFGLDQATDIQAMNGLDNGKIPYRDFQWIYGPLYLYAQYAAFKIFGESYYSIFFGKWIVLNYVGIFVAYIISRQLFSKIWQRLFFTTISILFICSNMVSLRHLIPELLLIIFLRVASSDKQLNYRSVGLLGFAFGVSFLFSIEYTSAALLGALIGLVLITGPRKWIDCWKYPLVLSLTFLIPIFSYALYLSSQDALKPMLEMYAWTIKNQPLTNPARPEYLPIPFQQSVNEISINSFLADIKSHATKFYFAPLILCASFLSALANTMRKLPLNPVNLVLTIYGTLIFFRAIVGPAYGFATYGFIPIIAISCVFFFDYIKKHSTRHSIVAIVCVLLLVAHIQDFLPFRQNYISNNLAKQVDYNVFNARVGGYLPDDFNSDLNALLKFLDENTDSESEFLEYPFGPVAFLAKKYQNVFYNKYFETIYGRDNYHDILIKRLQNSPSKYVILNKLSGEVSIGTQLSGHMVTYGKMTTLSPIFAGSQTYLNTFISDNYDLMFENKIAAVLTLQPNADLNSPQAFLVTKPIYPYRLFTNDQEYSIGDPIPLSGSSNNVDIELPYKLSEVRINIKARLTNTSVIPFLYKSRVHLGSIQNEEYVSYASTTDDTFSNKYGISLTIDPASVRESHKDTNSLRLLIQSRRPHTFPSSITITSINQISEK